MVLILAALTFITIDARSSGGGVVGDVRNYTRDAFSPLQKATHAALDPVGNFLTGALDYGSLRKENQRLRAQIAENSNASAQTQALNQADQQVEALQGLPFLNGISHVTAQVIDNSFSNFNVNLTISKGSSSGLAIGQPVVASGGLVGQIQSVSKSTAVVQLLTDPQFNVGVDLQGSNVGTATGQGLTRAMKISVDTTCLAQPKEKIGSILTTSGLSMESFPKGLPVARVSSVTAEPGGVEPIIEAHPLVNTSTLSYLDVLIWSPQGEPSATSPAQACATGSVG